MMKGVYNFRDLGGLKAGDGRAVKKGLLFRSGTLDDAEAEDIERMKNLGLKCIFDFRDLAEVSKTKDTYKLLEVERLHYPASLRIDKIYKLQKHPSLRNAMKKVYNEDVEEGYKLLPIENPSYKQLVSAVKCKNVPLLMHCSAGKDRAGMGSAIILKLLDVEYDEILTDYLKSLEIEEYIKQKIGERIPKFLHRVLFKRYQPLFIVDKAFLDAAFSSILEKYSSFENYFLQEFNITNEDITDIRNFYLE